MDIVSGNIKSQIGKVCEELHNVPIFGPAVWGCPLRANSEFYLRSHPGTRSNPGVQRDHYSSFSILKCITTITFD